MFQCFQLQDVCHHVCQIFGSEYIVQNKPAFESIFDTMAFNVDVSGSDRSLLFLISTCAAELSIFTTVGAYTTDYPCKALRWTNPQNICASS